VFKGREMIEAGSNEQEAKQFALQQSLNNPDMYVTLFACFGIFCDMQKRLNVFAPSDSLFGVYWLNGKEKAFTTKQRIADEKATPTLI
tara:strand:+ start:176 stop:439 length:264 start_codon:yes stop_codon:yes gene_type:complete